MTEETTVEVETLPEAEAAPVEESTPEVEEVVEEPTTTEPPPKKSGVQKRIDELTRQRYEAQQRAELAEQREQELRKQTFQQSYESTKPTLEDYNFDQDAWASAYEQWVQVGQEKSLAEQYQAAQAAEFQRIQAQQQQSITEKAYKAQEKYPDFFSKIQDPSLPSLKQISPAAYDAVASSEAMGDIAYYMASNPQEVYKLGTLSPVQAIMEIARLESKFTSKPTPTTSAPPPPPSDLKGRAEAITDPEKMTTAEWMEWRRSQLK